MKSISLIFIEYIRSECDIKGYKFENMKFLSYSDGGDINGSFNVRNKNNKLITFNHKMSTEELYNYELGKQLNI